MEARSQRALGKSGGCSRSVANRAARNHCEAGGNCAASRGNGYGNIASRRRERFFAHCSRSGRRVAAR